MDFSLVFLFVSQFEWMRHVGKLFVFMIRVIFLFSVFVCVGFVTDVLEKLLVAHGKWLHAIPQL